MALTVPAEAAETVAETPSPTSFDVIVVGAGFAGLYMLQRLRALGLSVRVLEQGGGVGGTWYWNRYPGCRCDVESLDYSYSFSPELEQEWSWSERYAAREEIERYLNAVADRFSLREDIRLETRVVAARYEDATATWRVETEAGEVLSARFCVMATGCLSARSVPRFPGLERFEGRVLHSAAWPEEEVDLTGQRVGIIGTGSSGVQAIPLIAEQADHLFVFQRTANFVVPARNAPLDRELEARRKAEYPEYRRHLREGFFGFGLEVNPRSALEVSEEEREAEYERRWALGGPALLGAFNDLVVDRAANDTAADFVRRKIAETVHDPKVARLLMPTGYPIGAKRLCQGTNYYETYNRDNVTLVDVRSAPIEELTPGGLRTSAGEYRFDTLVLATGFDAVTGAIFDIDVRGANGIRLKDQWAGGPRTYLGVASAGFPNLFLVTGPGSPSVLSNMVVSIEQHVDWIAECIVYMGEHGLARIEPERSAEDAWVDHVAEVASHTLFPAADSYYVGANIPGKPRVFMPYVGGVGPYRQRCEEVAAHGYAGFALSAQP